MLEVFAVGDSRAREVVLNSLRQPGVDFVPWVTGTRKAYKLWATLKGPEWFYRLGSVLTKKHYTFWIGSKQQSARGCQAKHCFHDWPFFTCLTESVCIM
jgi:hypothetical protein